MKVEIHASNPSLVKWENLHQGVWMRSPLPYDGDYRVCIVDGPAELKVSFNDSGNTQTSNPHPDSQWRPANPGEGSTIVGS